MTRQARQTLQGWGVAGPIILYFAIFSLIPLGMVFYYCFTDWDGLSSTWDIVGFENFKKIFTDMYYLRPLLNTFIISFFIIVTVEIDSVMFGRIIKVSSYLFSFLLTVIFSAIVNGAMYFKLKKINMVESLKSVE